MKKSCAIELLETRRLLNADFASLTHRGTLTVNGTDAADDILVRKRGSHISITLGAEGAAYPAANVLRVVVNGAGGNDRVKIDASLPATLLGGKGNDSITYNGSRASIINGNDGDDTIAIGDSNAVASGGAGNDTIIAYSGDCTLTGDDGNDKLQLQGAGGYLSGTAGNDTLIGGVQPDTLSGGRDDDILLSGSDDDEIIGGGGYDMADYSSRDVAVTAEIDIDDTTNVFTGFGGSAGEHDVYQSVEGIVGGRGDDSLSVRGGDTQFAELKFMEIDGGPGNDSLTDIDTHSRVYYSEELEMTGGPGDDVFTWNENTRPTMGGDAGDDRFVFADPTTDGSEIDGGPGTDALEYSNGWQGSLIVVPESVEDLQVQGASRSLSVYANDNGDTIDVQAASGTHLRVKVVGGAGADYIRVTGATTTMSGGDGNDTLIGSKLADSLSGGNGNDSLVGNGGDDTLVGGAGSDSIQP